MAMDGSRITLLLACLFGFAGGCQAVPPVPDHARDNPYQSGDDDEGWLMERLSGRDAAAPQRRGSGGVRQA